MHDWERFSPSSQSWVGFAKAVLQNSLVHPFPTLFLINMVHSTSTTILWLHGEEIAGMVSNDLPLLDFCFFQTLSSAFPPSFRFSFSLLWSSLSQSFALSMRGQIQMQFTIMCWKAQLLLFIAIFVISLDWLLHKFVILSDTQQCCAAASSRPKSHYLLMTAPGGCTWVQIWLHTDSKSTRIILSQVWVQSEPRMSPEWAQWWA